MDINKNKNILIKVLIFTLFLPILISCSKKTIEPISKTEFVIGTICTIKIYDNRYEQILQKAFNRIKNIENKMSINTDKSEVLSISQKSGNSYVKVSDDTFHVIRKGKEYSIISNGNFDISIGPLVKLWGIGTDYAKVPSEEEIHSVLPLINYNNVLLDNTKKKVLLKEKDMLIDLGAIAKGYAADEASKILKSNGVEHAIINLGGNILTIGNNPNGSPWNIGIQNPFSARGNIIGSLKVIDKSIVTSGIYERYIENQEKKYHHILNPKTGYPYENDIAGITIITPSSLDADALSTITFSKGVSEGMSFIEDLQNVEAIFVTKEKDIYITSGLKDKFTLSDTNFKFKPN